MDQSFVERLSRPRISHHRCTSEQQKKAQFIEDYDAYKNHAARSNSDTLDTDAAVAQAFAVDIPIFGLGRPPALVTPERIAALRTPGNSKFPMPFERKAMETLAARVLESFPLIELWCDHDVIHKDIAAKHGNRTQKIMLVDDPLRLSDAINTFQKHFNLKDSANDLSQSMASQSGVARETICRLRNSWNAPEHSKGNPARCIAALADYMDMKLRYSPQLGKDYIPGDSIIRQWEERGVDFDAPQPAGEIIDEELSKRGLPDHFMPDIIPRETINRLRGDKASLTRSTAYRLARAFERIDIESQRSQEKGEQEKPDLRAFGIYLTAPTVRHFHAERKYEASTPAGFGR